MHRGLSHFSMFVNDLFWLADSQGIYLVILQQVIQIVYQLRIFSWIFKFCTSVEFVCRIISATCYMVLHKNKAMIPRLTIPRTTRASSTSSFLSITKACLNSFLSLEMFVDALLLNLVNLDNRLVGLFMMYYYQTAAPEKNVSYSISQTRQYTST